MKTLIRIEKVDVYRDRLYCSDCDVEMTLVPMRRGDRYTYSCPKCHTRESMCHAYPRITYERTKS